MKLRAKSDHLKAINQQNEQRLDQQRYEEVVSSQKKNERLEQVKNKRLKGIKQEYEEQTNNYEDYKYKKEVQKHRIDQQKALNKCQTEKLHEQLQDKVDREQAILDY